MKDEDNGGIVADDNYALKCPLGCVSYQEQNLEDPIFVLDSDGSLSLNQSYQNTKVQKIRRMIINSFKNRS